MKRNNGTLLAEEPMGDSDPLLEEVVEIVINSGKVSTSYIQRRMSIGYGRAARIMDLLEEKGIIGPANGASPREILVKKSAPIRSKKK
jgi:S-DNA-T family DNA segregation ATPase FtsK/SpoIIIE